MHRSSDEWITAYQEKGALWIHDNNSKRPHALLTSGKHSNGFFNSELVMEDPCMLDQACADLVEQLEHAGAMVDTINRVVGPAMGAITLAHDLARHVTERYGTTCLRGYTEKVAQGDRMLMAFRRTAIKSGERILMCEDVVSTGGSVASAQEAVMREGGIPLPFVATLVNRSSLTEIAGYRIVALIDKEMPIWEPSACPLCAVGSQAIRPKGVENWARLNAHY